MNHEKELIHKNDEVEVLNQIDELIEALSLEVHNAISMTRLNVPIIESFTRSINLIDTMLKHCQSIKDVTKREIALVNVKNALNEFEEKLGQIN